MEPPLYTDPDNLTQFLSMVIATEQVFQIHQPGSGAARQWPPQTQTLLPIYKGGHYKTGALKIENLKF